MTVDTSPSELDVHYRWPSGTARDALRGALGRYGDAAQGGGRALTACEWCGAVFEAVKRGDREKRFCSDSCRAGFHSAARRWVQNAIEEGRLTIDELRAGVSSPCTAESEGSATFPAPNPRKSYNARSRSVHVEDEARWRRPNGCPEYGTLSPSEEVI